MKSTDFIVARDDLQHCKFIQTQLPDAAALPDETLLVKIDRFAFTANNITYAVRGRQCWMDRGLRMNSPIRATSL
jgi:hypothetical protein